MLADPPPEPDPPVECDALVEVGVAGLLVAVPDAPDVLDAVPDLLDDPPDDGGAVAAGAVGVVAVGRAEGAGVLGGVAAGGV